MRRCQDCWHKQDYRLPELRKKTIYLDQFVISNLMKLENPATKGHATVAADPFWRELHDLLFQLRHLQMICCPDSGSHEEESRTWPFNAELKKTYEALSGGITFEAFDSIKSMQIGELALAWAEHREPAFDFNSRRVLSKTQMSGTNASTSYSGTIPSFPRPGCARSALNSTPTSRGFSETFGAKRSALSSTGTSLSERGFRGIC